MHQDAGLADAPASTTIAPTLSQRRLGAVIRAIQSHLPFVVEAKAEAQRLVRQLRRRPFEPDFEVLAGMAFASGEIALDVGANRGQSIDAIRLFQPRLRIEAFEPNAVLAERLRVRFARDPAARVHTYGLGESESRSPLYIPHYCGYMYDGLASFDRSEAEGWLGPDTIAWFNPERLEIRQSECAIRRMDDLGLKPGFLKIDVQGFEHHVLEGGRDTLEAHRPLILMENCVEAETLLANWGWERAAWFEGRLHFGWRGAMNNLFVHPQARHRVAHLETVG
jgi:FkbM family methyltransferase